MLRLEYRFLDEERGFPIVSYYDPISKDEILLRFACDYLVQDHKVYEKTSCAIEDGVYIIYVKVDEEKKIKNPGLIFMPDWKGIRIEVRHYQKETKKDLLIHSFTFFDSQEALAHLMSDFIYLEGKEWEKLFAEVDENRKVYVYYAQPTSAII
ncbi:hypothetical protein [Thermoflavimicrobium dichotomicum]|uniref:Uncharacterized protein n=1 Tax=Thermoflavimicrobium dichotomicum TaxID=46223 RepID=A0A1I3JW81_9BACL|nr:hypothetical protein [Thermoflavimicrobium dichotomicum]SFI64340.1 hypothetical protein SAMN05421852_101228 [Thermoflavimicrobium dichotomicum]